METKYGKKLSHVKVQVLACLGPFVIGGILLAAAIIVLINCITGGFTSGKLTAIAILGVVGAALFVHCLMLLTKAGIDVYENAIVVNEVKIPYRMKAREYPAEDIFALLWEGPGENASNSRAMRKNSNTCEIITDGGRTSFRLSDTYYEESYTQILADFQAAHNISHDLEKRKKNRY